MESLGKKTPEKNPTQAALVIEHARLAADFASTVEESEKRSIVLRLAEIEQELQMSADQIAYQALSTYKK
jgi:hypothetical protein